MAVRIEPGSEPIAGYKLIERLGGGGFGEVWKAEAPGGLFKAIKFVYGDLQAADTDDGARAEQELKAMSRVKSVHHPYILSLERFDIIEGQLIIVMELADRTLWDRYKEARSQGNPGIPREELLGYVQETAEALDLMNMQFQLQHLDIKPQNLFLVFNHIKVADFGLVKDLGAMGAATMTGGVTPVYAAPETFDGWLSRFSDQYSLAIVYQELLTGHRPFTGSTMRQLVLQHLQAQPDVAPLPVAERSIITKALAKNPEERYPSCVELVKALREAKSAPVVAAPPVAPLPVAPVARPEKSQPVSAPDSDFFKNIPEHIGEGEKTWNARGNLSAPPMSLAPEPPNPLPVPEPPKTSPAQVTPSDKLARSAPPTAAIPPRGERPARPIEPPPPSSHLLDDNALRGVVQPALIIGLGDTGVQAIQQLRSVLTQEFGHPDAVPHIRLLGINTDGDSTRDSTVSDSRNTLRPHEFVLARLHRANHYVSKSRDGKLPTDQWLSQKLLYRINKENCKATSRPLGRFAFATNFSLISKRISCELQACCSEDTLHEMTKHTDLGIRSQTPRVYVVASLSGATGSGMFIDTAYLVRSHLRRMGMDNAEVVGLFFLPPVGREGIRSTPLANAHAALSELGFFTRQEGMQARYDSFDAKEPIRLDESGVPFQRCIFMTMTPPRSISDAAPTADAVAQAGQFLYRDLATKLGKSLDRLRQQSVEGMRLAGTAPSVLFQAFGLYRLGWPRREVQTRLAERLCLRVIDRWKAKKAEHLIEEIDEWVGQQWDALEMRPENLIARHQEDVQRQLGSAPDKLFQAIYAPVVQSMQGKVGPQAVLDIGPILTAMDQFEKLLGIPDACRDPMQRNVEPGSLKRALMEVSAVIGDKCDQKLAELVVGLIEAPRYRLVGAEEALRRFNGVAEAALKAQEPLGKELQDRAAALFARIQEHIKRADRALESAGAPTTTQWFGRNKSQANVADLLELLRVYPKTQFQALLLQCLNRLYISIRGHLSDQIREVGFCRTRLDELAGLVQSKKPAAAPRVEFEKHLLPAGCKRVDDVVSKLDESLTDEDILAFDERMQAHIRKQYKALLNVCLGPSAVVRALAPVMVHEAVGQLDQRFPPPNVIELLRARDNPEAPTSLEQIVKAMYDKAVPDVKRPDEDRQLSLAAVPNDETGQPLSDAVAAVLPETKVVLSDRCDELVFVREQILQNLGELEQLGPLAHEAYRQRLAQDPTALHSREDISNWDPQGATV